MPRVEFSEENKVATTNYDYPKLKLKQNERARIMAGLESPVMEFVHTLRAPVSENGRPVLVPVERGGKTTQEYKMNFISRPLCLGDAATLAAKGSDPKNCPVCKLAAEHPDMAKAPEARYAMHVIRYRTKGGTWEIQTPFSVELLVWAFTPKTFNKIADIKKEFESLQTHDLTLGPCTNEGFQQFDISVGAKAEWRTDDERKTIVAQTFKENQIPDLSIACGSKKERKWLEDDIAKIVEAWGEVTGASIPRGADDTAGLDEDLSNLLNSKTEKPQEEWAPEPAAEDDPLAGLLGNDAADAKPESSSGDDDAPSDFDDLLKSLA